MSLLKEGGEQAPSRADFLRQRRAEQSGNPVDKIGALVQSGKYDDALTTITGLDQGTRDSQPPLVKRDIGIALTRGGGREQWEESLPLFDSAEQAATTNEEKVGIAIGKAEALTRLGQYEEALAAYKTAQELDRLNRETAFIVTAEVEGLGPDATMTHLHEFAAKRLREGDLQGAITENGKVLALAKGEITNDSTRWAQFDKGIALMKLGRLPEAVTELKEAQRHTPDNTWTNSGLGLAYEKAGQEEEARGAFTEALRIAEEAGTTNEEAIEGLARLAL